MTRERNETLYFRKIDVIGGGHALDSQIFRYYASSVVHAQDDMTWCIQTARAQSVIFNIYRLGTPTAWALAYVNAIVVGYLLYYLSRWDTGFNYRNKDSTYFLISVGLPLAIGLNQNHNPKNMYIRWLYFLVASGYFVCITAWATFLYKYMAIVHYDHQIDSVAEMTKNNFEVGSTEGTISQMSIEGNVSIHFSSFMLFICQWLCSFYFCSTMRYSSKRSTFVRIKSSVCKKWPEMIIWRLRFHEILPKTSNAISIWRFSALDAIKIFTEFWFH